MKRKKITFLSLLVIVAFWVSLNPLAAEENARLVVQSAHTNAVSAAVYSPDGRTLLTVSDGGAKLWTTDGLLIRNISRPGRFRISFSRDSRFFALGNDVYLADGAPYKSFAVSSILFGSNEEEFLAVKGKEILLFQNFRESKLLVKTPSTPAEIFLSPDGQLLAARCEDYSIRFWSVSGEKRGEIRLNEHPAKAFFSPNSQEFNVITNIEASSMIFFKKKKFSLDVYDIQGRKLRTFSGSGNVQSVKFSPEGSQLYLGFDGWIRVFDDSFKQLREHRAHFNPQNDYDLEIEGLDVHPSNGQIVSASYHGFKIWDSQFQELRFIRSEINWGRGIQFDSMGTKLVVGGRHPVIYDASENKVIPVNIPDCEWVSSLSVFQSKLAALSCVSGKVQLVSLDGGLDRSFNMRSTNMATSSPQVVFAPEASNIVTADYGQPLKIWDSSGRLTVELPLTEVRVVFNPAGTKFAYYFDNGKGAGLIHVYSISGKLEAEINPIDSVNAIISAMTIHPDGNSVLIAQKFRGLSQYDLQGNRTRQLPMLAEINYLQYNRSGSMVLASTPGGIQIYDNNLKVISNHDHMTSHWDTSFIAFSPDSKTLATIGDDNEIRLRSVDTGDLKGMLSYSAKTGFLATTPDGRFDYSGKSDENLHWVVGTEVIPLSQFKEKYFTPGLIQEILASKGKAVKPLAKPEVAVSKRLVGRVFQIKANGDVVIFTKVSGSLRTGKKLKILNGSNYVDATIANTLHTNVTAKAKGAVAVGNPVFE